MISAKGILKDLWAHEENPQGFAINLHWAGGFWIHIDNGPGLVIQHLLDDPAIVIQYALYGKSGQSAIITNRLIFSEEAIEIFINSLLKVKIQPDGIYLDSYKHPIRVDSHGFLRIDK